MIPLIWHSARREILWYEEENDYAPFVTYLLGVIAAAYRDFIERTRLIEERTAAKPDRVAEAIKEQIILKNQQH